MNVRTLAGWLCLLAGCTVWMLSGCTDESGSKPEEKAAMVPVALPLESGTPPVLLTDGLTNLALRATVVVSSTATNYPGEGPAQNLVDGDLTSRWSSLYQAPQNIMVDFGKPVTVRAVRLHWEAASATSYAIAAATETTWKPVHSYFKSEDKPQPRVDTVSFREDVVTSRLKFELQRNVNPEWGFSLYEIEILGPTPVP
ncbi:MAG: hypothetical protein A2498_12770 [Lentisphaerae bacterium RIFOXYC12_FULL_60_16]|nr:MAG: hypothetical protein A2498_12770 [Lentisphaerae bacterium RIFOXYC12_FULL_60_16]OGV83928.1 MAG: hypothetical protein A2340_11750 [Lentisphaerae bacterium RIFOXYB12_FULL_60_10]